jgi:hypothetical protein
MKSLLSRFWTKVRPHLPAFSLALATFVLGFNTSVIIEHHYGNIPKLKNIAQQCIAGWKESNETIQRMRAACQEWEGGQRKTNEN